MAPLLSPKHGARNDRPLSGDMHGGDRGCPVTRDGRTRPRQGREGLGPGRVRRTPRGRTARTRLWALTLDGGFRPRRRGGRSRTLCTAGCVQLTLRVRGRLEGRVPDLRRPPASGKLCRAAVVGALQGSDPPGATGPWSETRASPCRGARQPSRGSRPSSVPAEAAGGGEEGPAGCRHPGLPPAGVRARPGGAEGAAGLGSLEGAEQTPFSSSPAARVPSPAAAGSSGQRWFSRPEGGGGRRDGRGPPRALHRPWVVVRSGGPGGGSHTPP